MSKGRMDDLFRVLDADGWTLLNSKDMYLIEDEIVRWVVRHPAMNRSVEILFYAFGDLGQEAKSLNEIMYLVVGGDKGKIYFEKRAKVEWENALAQFRDTLRCIRS